MLICLGERYTVGKINRKSQEEEGVILNILLNCGSVHYMFGVLNYQVTW